MDLRRGGDFPNLGYMPFRTPGNYRDFAGIVGTLVEIAGRIF